MWGRREWGWCESVYCAVGLVYHKPPTCWYYDRSEMDTVSFAQRILGVDDADRREGGEEGHPYSSFGQVGGSGRMSGRGK